MLTLSKRKVFVRIFQSDRGTERIRRAANAISLKDYSSFLRSKEAPA